MALDLITYALCKSYIKKVIDGCGALKGAPCEIQSITDITGGKRVTFKWEDKEGVSYTDTMDVMNGEPGASGYSPTISVKTSTSDEYVLTVTNEDGSYDTPNLKGGADSEIWKTQGALGAKNLLVYPYANGDGVYTGMSVATDNDGVITINGTNNTDSTGYYFIKNRTSASTKEFVSWLKSKGTSFRLSGGSSAIPIQVDFYNGENFAGSKQSQSNDTSVVVDIPTNADSMHMFLRFNRNVTADNLTIYPMIRLASDPDDTWQPYAPTNKQLSDSLHESTDIVDISDSFYSELAEGITINTSLSAMYKCGNHIFGSVTVDGITPNSSQNPMILTYLSKKIQRFFYCTNSGQVKLGDLNPNGNITLYHSDVGTQVTIPIDYVCQ